MSVKKKEVVKFSEVVSFCRNHATEASYWLTGSDPWHIFYAAYLTNNLPQLLQSNRTQVGPSFVHLVISLAEKAACMRQNWSQERSNPRYLYIQ
jgi:hypothetical protein